MLIRAAESPSQYLYAIKHTLEFLKEKFPTGIMSAIPLDAYHLCLPQVERAWTLVQVSLSLGFGKHIVTLPNSVYFLELSLLFILVDVGVLVLVVVQAQIIKLRNRGMKVSGVLNTVTRDAEIYFAVISSSHLLVIIMYSTTRVGFFSLLFEFNAC